MLARDNSSFQTTRRATVWLGLALILGVLAAAALQPVFVDSDHAAAAGPAATSKGTAPAPAPSAVSTGLAVLHYLDRPGPAQRGRAERSIAALAAVEPPAERAVPDRPLPETDSLRVDYASLALDLMARQDLMHSKLAQIMAATGELEDFLDRAVRSGDRSAAALAVRVHEVGERLGYYLRTQDAQALSRLDLARRSLQSMLGTAIRQAWDEPARRQSSAIMADVEEVAALARARARDVPRFIAMGERLDLLSADGRATPAAPRGDSSWQGTLAATPKDGRVAGMLVAAALALGLLALGYRRLLRRSVERRVRNHVRELTEQDPLTGLVSRTGLVQQLETALKTARRHNSTLALLLLDLDRFKDINDSLGHDHGDRLLQAIAHRLRSEVREIDVVARLGGDEFCLLLTDIPDVARSAEVAQRCLDALSRPIDIGAITIRPRGSVGIALHPHDAPAAQALLRAADVAMYAAKRSGGHRYAFYEARMTEETERQLAMEGALRTAVEQCQLELHYQPQVDLASGRMRGVEALLRWRHGERGFVPPDEFIPMAESMGLINEIGEWVMRTACRQALAWQRGGLTDLAVAVNISPGHFETPGFVESVARVLEETGLAPGRLEIEVTESVTRDPQRHVAISAALRRLGVGVAIDDFGTGYSSLSVLRQMPVDTLKIDRQFVWQMLDDAQSNVLVGAIIAMARGLNLEIVAEGVETIEQAQVLQALGCKLAQGFLFSRPVPADRIPALAQTPMLPTSTGCEQPDALLAAASR